MARSHLALAGAITTSFLLAFPALAGASSSPAKQGHSAVCAATRSFHQTHCGKGHAKLQRHKSRQLFFKAKNGVCRDAGMSPTTKNVRFVRAATLCLVNRER